MASPSIDPALLDKANALANLEHVFEVASRTMEMQDQANDMRTDFRKFVAAAWPQMEPAKAFIKSWHIDAIAEHLQAGFEGHILNLLLTVPPGSAKSLIACVAFPAWVWTRNPGWRSTYLSYDEALSGRDSVRCRDLLKSTWYQETFQPSWRFASDQNEKTYYVNTAKGFRVSGVATGWRGHGLIYDDPLNAKERLSDAALAKCVDMWDNVLFNRFIDMTTAFKCIIMQRLGDRDLAGHVLRKGGYEHLKIPLEYDPTRSKVTTLRNGVEWRDPRKVRGDVMCPELFPPAVVAELKTNMDRFSSQYQQEPNVEGGGILKSHCWNYWHPPGMGSRLPAVRVKMPNGDIVEKKSIELPDSFDIQLQSWDLTFGASKDSDLVCGQVHGARGAQRFVLDQVLRRMGIVETMNAIRELTGRHPYAHLKIIEKAANASAVFEMLEKEIPGMVLEPPTRDKVAMAEAAAHEVEAGNWFLPHPMISSWVGNPENPTESGFLASSSLFPFGANDDDVDAWSHGAVRIQKERIGGVFGASEKDIRVDAFDAKQIMAWPKAFGFYVDWREVGAVWICRQPQTGQHYLWAEYFAPFSDPAEHAGAIRRIGDTLGLMIADQAGRELKDGYALARKYMQLGLQLEAFKEKEQSAISDLSEAFQSGKLKVFAPLGRFFDQYRMFRRDDKGKLPCHNAGVIFATLAAWQGRDKLRDPVKPDANFGSQLGRGGWMSA